jgi:hypothetical protein
MSLYFTYLSTDLFTALCLMLPSTVLLQILLEIISLAEQCKTVDYFVKQLLDIKPSYFWREIWKRDMSSFIEPPMNSYEVYKDVLTYDSREHNPNGIYCKYDYLVAGGYDIILYPLLDEFDKTEVVMAYAACYGHMKIVEDMLRLGATSYDYPMEQASANGHIDVVNLMLKLGSKTYYRSVVRAAKHGHRSIVELILKLNDHACTIPDAMSAAALGGHLDLVIFLNGLNKTLPDEALREAAKGNHINIIRFLLENRNDYSKTKYYEIIKHAAKHKNLEMIELVISHIKKR